MTSSRKSAGAFKRNILKTNQFEVFSAKPPDGPVSASWANVRPGRLKSPRPCGYSPPGHDFQANTRRASLGFLCDASEAGMHCRNSSTNCLPTPYITHAGFLGLADRRGAAP